MAFSADDKVLMQRTYDTESSTHRAFVLNKTRALEKAFGTLSSNDQKVVGGGISLVGGALLSVIPFVGWLPYIASLAGTVVATWFTKGRDELSREYQEALNEAVSVYEWCFEDTEVSQILRYPELQALTLQLGPLLSKSQWEKWDPNGEDFKRLVTEEELAHQLKRGAKNYVAKGAHAMGRGMYSMFHAVAVKAGISSEDEIKEDTVEEKTANQPSSKEENAIFVAQIKLLQKGGTMGALNYKVYGYQQSLNPLSLLPTFREKAEEVVGDVVKDQVVSMVAGKK